MSTYTYNNDGQLATRVWARGITTSYTFDNAGRQVVIDYSDENTPDISFTYDWMGNPATVEDAAGIRNFSYNYTTSGHPGLVSVTIPSIINYSLNYTYDSLGRRTAMSLNNNSTPVFTNNYGYDSATGQLATVGDGTYTAHYTYQDGTGLMTQNQIKRDSDSAVITTHNRTYDTRLNNYHLLSASNTTGATTRAYSYVYNTKDQRTKLTLADGSYWEYTYDDKGQVTSGIKKDAVGNAIAGQNFGYDYDGIGNRKWETKGLTEMKIDYTSNNVNQYTQLKTPGVVPVIGEADTAAAIKALRTDEVPAADSTQQAITLARDGKYFSGAFTGIDNSTAAKTVDYNVYAIIQDTANNKELIRKEVKQYTVPIANETFTYDPDGNMTSDGTGWNYTWNGENRMIAAEKSDMKLEFVYDYMGRRVSKKVYTGSTGNWTLSSHKKFVYQGFKQIAEYDSSDVLQKTYTWQPVGLDVPLWVKDGSNYYYYIVDGNKNVRAMVDVSGNEVAQYDYNPFGKVVASNGTYKDTNKYRFSSEYHDDEIRLVYYNYRYYDAGLGRWTKRDSIGELDESNLYLFIHNAPVNITDTLGLLSVNKLVEKIKRIKWERRSEFEVKAYRTLLFGMKASTPLIIPILKKILKEQLKIHGKDDIAHDMFKHYFDGGGERYTLTVEQMKQMSTGTGKRGQKIDVRRTIISHRRINPKFTEAVRKALRTGKRVPYSVHINPWGWDNGSIGNYEINIKGEICPKDKRRYVFFGTMNFSDTFDFNPNWNYSKSKVKFRTPRGERRTRIGYVLSLGTDFKVDSKTLDIYQNSGDKHMTIIGEAYMSGTTKKTSSGDI